MLRLFRKKQNRTKQNKNKNNKKKKKKKYFPPPPPPPPKMLPTAKANGLAYYNSCCIRIIAELPLAVRPAGGDSILIKACPSFFMVMASEMPRGRMCSTLDVAQHPGYDIFFHGLRDRVWLINGLIIIFAVLHF